MRTMNTEMPVDAIGISWAAVEAMTAAMHTAAEALDWFRVVEQSAARHHCLMQHFELFPAGPNNAEFYREHLASMLNGEQKLQDIVRDARKSLMRESMTINQRHRAVGAYLDSALGS